MNACRCASMKKENRTQGLICIVIQSAESRSQATNYSHARGIMRPRPRIPVSPSHSNLQCNKVNLLTLLALNSLLTVCARWPNGKHLAAAAVYSLCNHDGTVSTSLPLLLSILSTKTFDEVICALSQPSCQPTSNAGISPITCIIRQVIIRDRHL